MNQSKHKWAALILAMSIVVGFMGWGAAQAIRADDAVLFSASGNQDNEETQLDSQREKPEEKQAVGRRDEEMKMRAARAVALNNMKHIALAQHIYADKHRTLAGNICDAQGKPLLSWRVRLLPYLEQEALYKQFHLDEPWDSEHNRALMAKMPAVFRAPGTKPTEFVTPFRSFVGNGAIMETCKSFGFPDVTDGTSNTLMFVEAAEGVPWTKPDDLPFDPKNALPKLGGRFDQDFLASFCDGSVRLLPVKLKTETLKKLITRNGSEIVEQEELERKPGKDK